MNYYIYKTATGEITGRYIGVLATVAAQLETGEDYFQSVSIFDDLEWYIDSEQMTERPESTAVADNTEIDADGVDACTVTLVEVGAAVRITGPDDAGGLPILFDDVVTDGEIILTTNDPGPYRITIDLFPNKQKVIDINAT